VALYSQDGEIPNSPEGREGSPRWFSAVGEAVEKKVEADKAIFVCWQKERVLSDLGWRVNEKRALIDLYQFSWILCGNGELRTRQLQDVAAWCEAKGDLEDVASRVVVIRDCYFRLMDRFRLGLEMEGIGRALAEKVTDGAQATIARFFQAFTGGPKTNESSDKGATS
jgi:hypothetical protein